MKKKELLIKSREAMLSAVQTYINPQFTFKSENYIVLSIIAWIYLLHCYYFNHRIDCRYAYRILFTRLNAKRKGQADQVVEFIPEGTQGADSLNKTYILIKETEKKKYLSKEIVDLMIEKGYTWFSTGAMTQY